MTSVDRNASMACIRRYICLRGEVVHPDDVKVVKTIVETGKYLTGK